MSKQRNPGTKCAKCGVLYWLYPGSRSGSTEDIDPIRATGEHATADADSRGRQ